MFKNCMIKAEPFKKNNQTDKEKNNSNLFIKNLPLKAIKISKISFQFYILTV